MSRSSKRGESKTSESGQSQNMIKTQLMPNFGLMRPMLKEKLKSGNIGQLSDKIN